MFSAFSYYCLGRVMQQFQPHTLVNYAVGFHALFKRPEPQSYTVRIAHGDEVQIPPPVTGGIKPLERISDALRAAVRPNVQALHTECGKLLLEGSYACLDRMLGTLDDPQGVWQALVDDGSLVEGRIVDELKSRICFALEGRSAEYYRADQLLGSEVADHLPSTAFDIAEAAKCLAFDRATACVMHLQRVLEVGLDALGKAVGMTKPLRDWGKYVTEIAAELERRFKASGARTPDEQFYAETHVTFDAMRRAWRNPSMHCDKTYTVDHATDIFNAARSFMKHLATRLHE